MSTFKCKMCGGSLNVPNDATVLECEYCGTTQTLPKLDSEKRESLYDRANHFRRNNEYDKASEIFEMILNEEPTDAEAYWSLVLCHYGIEYVEDPKTHKRMPTINRAQYTSIFDDSNYKSAIENADLSQKAVYEKEAEAINKIQKGILAISQSEEPFDVFICYKETDESGRRTHDSVLANDLYHQLKQEGFKVFFSRITLEDKLGTAYEPYIFAALNSAKVMVVLGTRKEYFNAVWVKNEWSRFLSLIKQGANKTLIPAYRDMDPYDLPIEFSHLQAQDMSKLGFMQDLIRGIKKIAGKTKKAPVPVERVEAPISTGAQSIAPLLKRAYLFLEDGEYDKAFEYGEKILDIDPECADAYILKLVLELGLKKPEELENAKRAISDSPNFKKAVRFANEETKNKLIEWNNTIVKKIEEREKEEIYLRAVALFSKGRLNEYEAQETASLLASISGYRDADELVSQIDDLRNEDIYQTAEGVLANAEASDGDLYRASEIFYSIESYKDSKEKIKYITDLRYERVYQSADALVNKPNVLDSELKQAIKIFNSLGDYKDSRDRVAQTEYFRKEKIYKTACYKTRPESSIEEHKKGMALFQAVSGFLDADALLEVSKSALLEKEENLRRLEEKKKRKRRKAILLSLASLAGGFVAMLLAIILFITVILPSFKMAKADNLYKDGEYNKALEIYLELDGFGNSENKAKAAELMIRAKLDSYVKDVVAHALYLGFKVETKLDFNGGSFDGKGSFSHVYDLDKIKEEIYSDDTLTEDEKIYVGFFEYFYQGYVFPEPTKDGQYVDYWQTKSLSIDAKKMIVYYSAVAEWNPIFVFAENDTGVTLKKYDQNEKNVVIPSEYNGKPVTSIGDCAFSNCENVESIEIPNSVTSIGDFAFLYCISLKSIVIPNSVTSIGDEAFYCCTSLAEINFNAKAMDDLSEDNYVFYNAGKNGDGIKVTIGKEVTKIPAYLFYPNSTSSCSPKITSVEFEEGSVCQSIGDYAFAYCDSLANVTIPSSVTSMGSYAFYNCSNLTEINFNAKAMDDLSSNNYVFYNAGKNGEGIKVTIAKEVTKIPAYLFYPYYDFSYSPKITSVEFEEGSVCQSIGERAFYYSKSLTSITIPDSVTNIGSYAFYYCTGLTSVTIDEGVTSIGDYAFYNCTNLTEINFNAKAMDDLSEDNYVFYNAGKNGEGIKVTIGKDVTKIPAYLFCPYSSSPYSPKITSVEFEEGSVCQSIGDYAFAYCDSLANVTIPSSVTSIGDYAFYNCTALDEIYFNAIAMDELDDDNYVFYNAGTNGKGITVTIGKEVTKIPAYLFYPCWNSSYSPKITSVVFEEGSVCESIGYSAFEDCTSLKSVTIGDSVTSIGYYAFSGCTGLTSITIPNSVVSIGEYAFYGCSKLYNEYDTAYYIGNLDNPYLVLIESKNASYSSCIVNENTKFIHSRAFYGCTGLKSITIPDGVTNIGDCAFDGCTNLTSVTIPSSVTSIGYYAFEDCTSLKIYCEVESKPSGWDDYWADSSCTIYWGTTLDGITAEGLKWRHVASDNIVITEYTGSETEIVIPSTINNRKVIKIEESAFFGCSFLESVTIPENVTSIGNEAFSGCTGLTSVNYLGTIEQWCNIEFDYYANPLNNGASLYINGELLTELVIPNTVTEIKTYAFEGCTSLTSINIPDSVTSIGDDAFSGCTGLTSITIPDSVTSIGYYAFCNCTSLTSIEIPDSVTSIGDGAFEDCTSLTSITIPDSVTSIGYYAFYRCTSLTIYCEAESKPSGWEPFWNSSGRPVVWGYKK